MILNTLKIKTKLWLLFFVILIFFVVALFFILFDSDIEFKLTLTEKIILVSIVFFNAFLIYIATHSIAEPFTSLRKALDSASKGDFTTELITHSDDEIGQVIKSYNDMRLRLNASLDNDERQEEELKRALTQVSTFASIVDEQRNLYLHMLSSIGNSIIITDPNRTIMIHNKVAEDMFGLNPTDIQGKKVEEIVKFVYKDKTPLEYDIWQQAFTTRKVMRLYSDIFILNKNNETVAVSATISPIIDQKNDCDGIIITIRDTSIQRQLEETRVSFISVASHQLRTPLTSMRWFTEMLLNGDAGKITKKQKEFIDLIYQGTNRMINLVNLLLQIARVEAHRLKIAPAPTDLKKMTLDVGNVLKANFDEKSLKLKVIANPDPLPQIAMDPDILWQVVLNLLSNAIRYSPQKGTITVSATVKNDIVEYVVKDQGIGIPEAEKDKIFQKFFRAHNALQAVPEGSGLGLSLVKSLVEGWSGKIWFESQENKGTSFFVTIPLKGMQAKEGDVSIAV
jgi:PAS domain S-box-containing protein